jgi:hypothetical protein
MHGWWLQVEWLKERIQNVPIRIVFESALELMGSTEIGTFKVMVCLCLGMAAGTHTALQMYESVNHLFWERMWLVWP